MSVQDEILFDDIFEGLNPSGTGPAPAPVNDEDEPTRAESTPPVVPPAMPSAMPQHTAITDPQDDNKGWSDDVTNIVSSMGKKTYGLREMHDMAGALFEYRSRRLGGTLIITSGIASLLTVFDSFTFLQNNVFPVSYGVKILNPVVTFMTVWSRYRAYSTRAESHRNAARRLRNLLTVIQQQLVMAFKDRSTAPAFIDKSFRQFEQINAEAPDIPEETVAEWKKKYGGTYGNVQEGASPDVEQGLDPGINLRNLTVSVDPNSVLLRRQVGANGNVVYTVSVDPLTQLQLTEFYGGDTMVT